MKVIVNDANILIDLIELELLPCFFALDFNFYTTSLVYEELDEGQQSILDEFISVNAFQVREMTEGQLDEIFKIQKTKPGLSPQDCSAYFQARIENGILVTSDNKLRKFAQSTEIEVHGHLWVFDKMWEAQIITGTLASTKLEELRTVINRNLGLPESECQRRIDRWEQ